MSESTGFVPAHDNAAANARAGVAQSNLDGMSNADPAKARVIAKAALSSHAFDPAAIERAEQTLGGALRVDPSDPRGETNHLLGLLYFQRERWSDAVKHLSVAVARNPGNREAATALERARVNADTAADAAGGPTAPLDGERLLTPPALHLRAPEEVKPLAPATDGGFVRIIDRVTGTIGGVLVQGVIKLVAAFARDRSKTFAFESWDAKGALVGKLELGGIRDELNGDRLVSTYDQGVLVGFQKPGQPKPAWTDRFRTATGAWTTDDPMEGAAGTEFQRSGAGLSTRSNRALDATLPNAREVSRALLHAKGPRSEVPFLNLLAIAWIQFQNHDWVNHRPQNAGADPYKIPLREDDPIRVTYGVDTMYVPATAPNPLEQKGKITFLNEVTHWWDASQIYGSDQSTQDRLRADADGKSLPGGKLRIDGDLLPVSRDTGLADSGFTRNWWTGLELLHTVFVKNHNAIADKLASAHRDWSSDQVFHTARLVNAAVLAKIHTVEWTPAVLPNRKLVGGMGTNWWGLIEEMRRPFEKRRVNRLFEPRHPVLGGIVGGDRDNHGKPYGLSEEFVEVYRLHSGMPEQLAIKPVGKPVSDEINIVALRGNGSRATVARHGLATLLNSFGHQHMNALVHNNYPAFMTDMTTFGGAVVDLGAIDILRARERGIPPYNQFRRDLGLNPIKSFHDLGVDDATARALERLYGEDAVGVEKMDLLVGTLCEVKRPHNYGFGETLFQVFIQMATRRLQADPFYTNRFDERHYSKEGMEIIERSTLKSVLLEHAPELAATGLAEVNNAFEPWGTNATTHPGEHPLTSESERYVASRQ